MVCAQYASIRRFHRHGDDAALDGRAASAWPRSADPGTIVADDQHLGHLRLVRCPDAEPVLPHHRRGPDACDGRSRGGIMARAPGTESASGVAVSADHVRAGAGRAGGLDTDHTGDTGTFTV